jgi:pimeloyl-ACP methyl ester carboxylesterase
MDLETFGDGPLNIVALHGIQGTRASWRGVAENLVGEARFVLPNLRGRGSAHRATGAVEHTLDCFAADAAEAVREQIGNKPFVLAGWSMGVSVALQYVAGGFGPRPSALVLLSGTPCVREAAWFAGDGELLRRAVIEREQRLRLKRAADVDAVVATWLAIRDTDQRGLLPSIDIPALVMHGDADDESPPPHAEWLREGLPSATLARLAGVGHSLPIEAPGWVADQMRRFMAQLPSLRKDPPCEPTT